MISRTRFNLLFITLVALLLSRSFTLPHHTMRASRFESLSAPRRAAATILTRGS